MATNPAAAPAGAPLTAERNGVRFGLLTAAALCVYTLIAVLAGFFQNITAGALDVAILMLGSVLAIRNFRSVRGDHMPYLGGYGTGIITALIASVILGLFFVVMQAVFPAKLDLTQVENVFGFELSTVIALLAIILMGTMAGVMTSLIAMQYFKVQVSDPLAMMKES
ncbi:MAG: hypothetical protein EOO56_20370 [Hymenobacter sp.]|nr:MAG: hypothetical protein EOO56_20370 [Hymenobacter sp.]